MDPQTAPNQQGPCIVSVVRSLAIRGGQAPIFRHRSSRWIVVFPAEKSEPDPSAVNAYEQPWLEQIGTG